MSGCLPPAGVWCLRGRCRLPAGGAEGICIADTLQQHRVFLELWDRHSELPNILIPLKAAGDDNDFLGTNICFISVRAVHVNPEVKGVTQNRQDRLCNGKMGNLYLFTQTQKGHRVTAVVY